MNYAFVEPISRPWPGNGIVVFTGLERQIFGNGSARMSLAEEIGHRPDREFLLVIFHAPYCDLSIKRL